jgi:hypothetical protein
MMPWKAINGVLAVVALNAGTSYERQAKARLQVRKQNWSANPQILRELWDEHGSDYVAVRALHTSGIEETTADGGKL